MTSLLDQHHPDHELEEHDRGLVYDLTTLDLVGRCSSSSGSAGASAGLFVLAG